MVLVCTTKNLARYISRSTSHLASSCGYVLRRVRKKLYAVNHVKHTFSRVIQLLYIYRYKLILSVLDYCNTVWSPSNSTSTCRLERLHSKFTSSLPSSSINLNLQSTVTERHTFHKALQVFRIVNKICPPYLHGIFSYAVGVTGHSGRNVHRLFVPSAKTSCGKQSLAFGGTAIWNSLHKALYSAKTADKFKNLYHAM